MVIHEIDGISFRLKNFCDLTWIKRYGRVFSVIDATGSGCISFGVVDNEQKYFIKIAGVDTVDAEISPEESIRILKNAMNLYQIMKHPNLVELIEHYSISNYYVAVFQWVEGSCLFDHWNFEEYDRTGGQTSPMAMFKKLSNQKKLMAAEDLFTFLETVAANHYVAVDFYDGSLIYNFKTNRITICDIDLFRRQPAFNDIGEDYWGTKRLKAPEEYISGALIDEKTNIFTLGALLFDFFGIYSGSEIESRYINNRFLPCPLEKWTLNKESYFAVLQAVEPNRAKRYKTIYDFHKAFQAAISVSLFDN